MSETTPRSEGWYVQYNPLDCYYELISPIEVIVHRFPLKQQAWDALKMVDNYKAPEELTDETEEAEESHESNEWREEEDEEEDYEFFQEGDQEDQETL
tara:strand:- start:269 stop:562 length:294 start_codon:yes stop_codon:yes gene_type:complete